LGKRTISGWKLASSRVARNIYELEGECAIFREPIGIITVVITNFNWLPVMVQEEFEQNHEIRVTLSGVILGLMIPSISSRTLSLCSMVNWLRPSTASKSFRFKTP
jgi:hypothetical protein